MNAYRTAGMDFSGLSLFAVSARGSDFYVPAMSVGVALLELVRGCGPYKLNP